MGIIILLFNFIKLLLNIIVKVESCEVWYNYKRIIEIA